MFPACKPEIDGGRPKPPPNWGPSQKRLPAIATEGEGTEPARFPVSHKTLGHDGSSLYRMPHAGGDGPVWGVYSAPIPQHQLAFSQTGRIGTENAVSDRNPKRSGGRGIQGRRRFAPDALRNHPRIHPILRRLTRKYRCLGGIPCAVKLLKVKVRCRWTRKRSLVRIQSCLP